MANDIDLKGRAAVVTGGAQGFGKAITERFLKSGARIAIWDRDTALAEKTARAVETLAWRSPSVGTHAAVLVTLAGSRISTFWGLASVRAWSGTAISRTPSANVALMSSAFVPSGSGTARKKLPNSRSQR